jgi:hypothetical protein
VQLLALNAAFHVYVFTLLALRPQRNGFIRVL